MSSIGRRHDSYAMRDSFVFCIDSQTAVRRRLPNMSLHLAFFFTYFLSFFIYSAVNCSQEFIAAQSYPSSNDFFSVEFN